MATKEERAEEINQMLGTDIEWDRLLREDLDHFYDLVENGGLLEPLAKQVAKEHGKKRLEKEIDNWYPGKVAARFFM